MTTPDSLENYWLGTIARSLPGAPSALRTMWDNFETYSQESVSDAFLPRQALQPLKDQGVLDIGSSGSATLWGARVFFSYEDNNEAVRLTTLSGKIGRGVLRLTQPPPPRNISVRRLLLPRDTNHRGEIFGGALLAEIDLAGAIEARRYTLHDVATRAVKEVVFKQPVRVGDVVTFYTSLVKVGNSSIHVQVEVEASRDGEPAPVSVTAAEVVYVAIQRLPDGSIQKVSVA